MAGQIKVNTEQVSQIASDIEGLNRRLDEELKNSQSTIKGLSSIWEGSAAEATINAFDDFSTKYFQNYYDIIDNYVKFLRQSVDQGYVTIESTNTSLSEAFK